MTRFDAFFRRARRWLRPPRRLRVTRQGKYFIAITIGIGLAAINTGNNLLYLLLGWLISVIVASGILSERVLRGLEVSRTPPARLHAGRPFLMGISLKNLKTRIPSFSIEIEDLFEDRPVDKKCYFLKLPTGRTQSTSYRHTFQRRGLYRLTGFRISTKFPFGLFRKSRDVDIPAEVIVYPALHPVTVPPPQPRTGGEDARSRLGRHGEFFGLREHREGDDLRNVHWRSSARHQKLMVRELEEESHRRVSILLDNALPEKPSDEDLDMLERAVSLAASLAVAYLGRGYVVRLAARGAQVPGSSGPGQQARILRALALLPAVSDAVPLPAPDPTSETLMVGRQGLLSPPGVARVEAV